MRLGAFPWDHSPQHGKHLQPDDRRRAVDVTGELVECAVVGHAALFHRAVHLHRDHEIREVLRIDLVADRSVHRRGEHRVVRTALRQPVVHLLREDVQLCDAVRPGPGVGQVVDDLVGIPRQPVESVDRRPLGRCQQPGR